MNRRRGLLLLLLVLPLLGLVTPGRAAPLTAELSRTGQVVSWTGTLGTPDPTGCGELLSRGCDVTRVAVRAAQGTWITMDVDTANAYVRVEERGVYVAGQGNNVGTKTLASGESASTTFQQVRSGLVSYDVGVSHLFAAGPLAQASAPAPAWSARPTTGPGSASSATAG